MVYEGYSEGFINKLITGKARVVSDKNCGLLQTNILGSLQRFEASHG